MPLHSVPLAALTLALALAACGGPAPVYADPSIERGTALPPPGLSEPPPRR